ncbi:hypothetical protein DPMN_120183, partial [Dreissena polymorpha]
PLARDQRGLCHGPVSVLLLKDSVREYLGVQSNLFTAASHEERSKWLLLESDCLSQVITF